MTSSELDTPISRRLRQVKHIILVLSGKGGVGKSSVSTQLALSLHASSPTARVGILDIDLTGPSIPRMLGVDGSGVHQSSEGWVPVYADGMQARLACMSVGFLLKKRGDSVVWRGPKKNAMIRQFLSDVRWGELDYLVVDTPPVLVTTPQAVALSDAMKCLSFTRTVNLPILGLIENMSGFVCPCCGEISNVFSTGGGKEMARREKLTFLGSLPVDTELVRLLDAAAVVENEAEAAATQTELSITDNPDVHSSSTVTSLPSFPLMERYRKTPTYKLFTPFTEQIIASLAAPATHDHSSPVAVVV